MSDQTLSQPIHIICPSSAWADDEVSHLMQIYESLKPFMQVELWTEVERDAGSFPYPIRVIRPYQGAMPRSGTLIFAGTAKPPGAWYDHAGHERVLLDCSVFSPAKLYCAINRLSLGGRLNVNVLYSSEMIAGLIGIPGTIQLPTRGLEPFLQIERVQSKRPFTIGRMSRNNLSKHHFRDISLYKKLIQEGVRVKVVGGECLTPFVEEEITGLELAPEMPAQDLPHFLAELDCFFYRTSLHCPESVGTCILQAMASGLAVVAHRQGGYRDLIAHGINGYLFDTDAEAIDIVYELKCHPEKAKGIGNAARETVSEWQKTKGLGLLSGK